MIVMLWRAGLRVQEALALAEHDLDPRRGSLLVRNGKGGRRREVGMDEWGWEQLCPWLERTGPAARRAAVLHHRRPTGGRAWSAAAVRSEFRRLAARAGVRRRFAPHQLRHAHALELAREGVPLNIIQRQLGHANLGTTSIYLQGIDPEEIIATVRRAAPRCSASAGLQTLDRDQDGAGAPSRCSRSSRAKRASGRAPPRALRSSNPGVRRRARDTLATGCERSSQASLMWSP